MQAPTLEGPHVRLEPLTLAHLPALEAIAFDPTIWRYMLSILRTPADLRAWADTALATPNTLTWVTINKSDNQPVGSTRFIDLDLTHRTTELGHTWLAAPARGTLINAEAKLLQLTYAFETLHLNRVALKTHHENLQSQNAMKNSAPSTKAPSATTTSCPTAPPATASGSASPAKTGPPPSPTSPSASPRRAKPAQTSAATPARRGSPATPAHVRPIANTPQRIDRAE